MGNIFRKVLQPHCETILINSSDSTSSSSFASFRNSNTNRIEPHRRRRRQRGELNSPSRPPIQSTILDLELLSLFPVHEGVTEGGGGSTNQRLICMWHGSFPSSSSYTRTPSEISCRATHTILIDFLSENWHSSCEYSFFFFFILWGDDTQAAGIFYRTSIWHHLGECKYRPRTVLRVEGEISPWVAWPKFVLHLPVLHTKQTGVWNLHLPPPRWPYHSAESSPVRPLLRTIRAEWKYFPFPISTFDSRRRTPSIRGRREALRRRGPS